MKDITNHDVQMFIRSTKLAPKSLKNAISYLEMAWKSAKAWGYVNHDPFDGLVLPKAQRNQRFFFNADEIRRILETASEPHKTLYWLAAEGGLRAGELCGLRALDVDVNNCTVHVRQSIWQGRIQTPKTPNAYRQFAISAQLAAHLRAFLCTGDRMR